MKQKLLTGFTCLCILGGSFWGEASPTDALSINPQAPYIVMDGYRIIVGLIAGIMNLSDDGENSAQLIAQEEENNKKANGQKGQAGSTDTTNDLSDKVNSSAASESDTGAATSQFSGSAFDYVNSTLFAKNGNIGYAPLKSALSGDRQGIQDKVTELFYADPLKEKQKSTEYQEQIRSQRNKYIKEAAERHMWVGYNVKGYIQNDLLAIASASLGGDGEIGLISVDSHTLEQMIKMEMVELAMQIELMEADAIHFMMHQPITLMSATKSK